MLNLKVYSAERTAPDLAEKMLLEEVNKLKKTFHGHSENSILKALALDKYKFIGSDIRSLFLGSLVRKDSFLEKLKQTKIQKEFFNLFLILSVYRPREGYQFMSQMISEGFKPSFSQKIKLKKLSERLMRLDRQLSTDFIAKNYRSETYQWFEALEKKDVEKVKKIVLASKFNPEDMDFYRMSFMLAAEEGEEDLIEYLIKKKIDINTVNTKEKNILMIAIEKEQYDFAWKNLLTRKININHQDYQGSTAMIMIVKHPYHLNSALLFKKLLTKKPNLNILDFTGKSALYYAVYHKNFKVIEALMKAGADKSITDRQGNNLVHILITSPIYSKETMEIYKVLIKNEIPVEKRDELIVKKMYQSLLGS